MNKRLCEFRDRVQGEKWARELLKEGLKQILKDEVAIWMLEHGVSGNIVIEVNVAWDYNAEDWKVHVGYIAVWNSDYTTGKLRGGWMNELMVNARSTRFVQETLNDKRVVEWAPRIEHRARTDPAYQGEDLFYSYEGFILNLLEEVYDVFTPMLERNKH